MAKQRVGGLRIDPGVAEWQKGAATNLSSLSKKQRLDRARVRVKYDMPPELKELIESEAKKVGTSASQMASLLLLWAAKEYRQGNGELQEAIDEGRSIARTMRFEWNVALPDEWLKLITDS
jgi:hypothetical protein